MAIALVAAWTSFSKGSNISSVRMNQGVTPPISTIPAGSLVIWGVACENINTTSQSITFGGVVYDGTTAVLYSDQGSGNGNNSRVGWVTVQSDTPVSQFTATITGGNVGAWSSTIAVFSDAQVQSTTNRLNGGVNFPSLSYGAGPRAMVCFGSAEAAAQSCVGMDVGGASTTLGTGELSSGGTTGQGGNSNCASSMAWFNNTGTGNTDISLITSTTDSGDILITLVPATEPPSEGTAAGTYDFAGSADGAQPAPYTPPTWANSATQNAPGTSFTFAAVAPTASEWALVHIALKHTTDFDITSIDFGASASAVTALSTINKVVDGDGNTTITGYWQAQGTGESGVNLVLTADIDNASAGWWYGNSESSLINESIVSATTTTVASTSTDQEALVGMTALSRRDGSLNVDAPFTFRARRNPTAPNTNAWGDYLPPGAETITVTHSTTPLYPYIHTIVIGEPVPLAPNTGTADGTFSWAGAATGSSPRGGSADGGFGWAGSADGATDPSGSGDGAFSWSGGATGSTPRGGSADGGFAWGGNATGTQPSLDPNTGSASGGFGWAGSATGSSPRGGSADGNFGWAGGATGVAPGVPINTGSASGTFSWAGAATGEKATGGSADGGFAWTGDATGEIAVGGDADGGFAWVGGGTGETQFGGGADGGFNWNGNAVSSGVASGSGDGTFEWTGGATGAVMFGGIADGGFSWAGGATGVAPAVDQNSGSASGGFGWVGGATGAVEHRSDADGSFNWSGGATGVAPVVGGKAGAALGSFAWAGAATGVAPVLGVPEGSASGTFSWAGVAIGVSQPNTGSASGGFNWAGDAIGVAGYEPFPVCILDLTPTAPSLTLDVWAPELTLDGEGMVLDLSVVSGNLGLEGYAPELTLEGTC